MRQVHNFNSSFGRGVKRSITMNAFSSHVVLIAILLLILQSEAAKMKKVKKTPSTLASPEFRTCAPLDSSSGKGKGKKGHMNGKHGKHGKQEKIQNEESCSETLVVAAGSNITTSVTLTETLLCGGVDPCLNVTGPDAVLDCAGNIISSKDELIDFRDPTSTGVVLSDGATVRNCRIMQFDTAILVGDGDNVRQQCRSLSLCHVLLKR